MTLADVEKLVRGSRLAHAISRRAGAVVSVLQGSEAETVQLGKGVSTSTPVQVGSLTKIFTGLLLAQAVELDAISLDSRVDELLFGTHWHPHGITALQLATHTSGLPRLSIPFLRRFHPDPYRSVTRAHLIEYLERRKPQPPSESISGTAILALPCWD